MWIVAVAWVYVVGLMALTEPSIVAGVMTFLGYCVLPLSILFYITGGKARRARREAQESSDGSDSSSSSNSNSSSSDSDCSTTDSDSGCSDSGGGDSSSD